MRVGWKLVIRAMVLYLAIEDTEGAPPDGTPSGSAPHGTTPAKSRSWKSIFKFKSPPTSLESPPDCCINDRMKEKTAIVTGANRGIGFETARQLHELGFNVIMGCRDLAKCGRARNKIFQLNGHSHRIHCIRLDLESYGSIRNFVDELNRVVEGSPRFPKIHIIIDNAGIQLFIAGQKTKEDKGQELTMMVNYLGPWYLTRLLIPKLEATAAKESKPSRIVVVTHHDAMRKPHLNVNDLNAGFSDKWPAGFHYPKSKSALFLLAIHLDTLFKRTQSNIIVNAVSPRIAATDLKRKEIFNPVYKMVYANSYSPARSAESIVTLSTSPEYEKISGAYFVELTQQSLDTIRGATKERAETLWQTTEKLVSGKIAPNTLPPIGPITATAEAPIAPPVAV